MQSRVKGKKKVKEETVSRKEGSTERGRKVKKESKTGKREKQRYGIGVKEKGENSEG